MTSDSEHMQTYKQLADKYLSRPLDQAYQPLLIVPDEMRLPQPLKGWARGLDDTFSFCTVNPSSARSVQRFRLLYQAGLQGIEDADEEPTVPPNDQLLNALTERSKSESEERFVMLMGPRGSGKSSAQNEIIVGLTSGESFFSRGYTFFRADVSKLVKFHRSLNRRGYGPADVDTKRMSIRSYMELHAAFVIFAKGRDETCVDPAILLFKTDAEYASKGSSREENLGFESPFLEWVRNEDSIEHSRLSAVWFRLILAFRARGTVKDDDLDVIRYLTEIHDDLHDNSLFSPGDVADLFEYMVAYITGRDRKTGEVHDAHRTAEVVVIVDGVDNIRFDDYDHVRHLAFGTTSSDWYERYLRDLEAMMQLDGWLKLVPRRLFALRPETWADVKELLVRSSVIGHTSSGDHATSKREKYPVFKMQVPNVDLIVLRKVTASDVNEDLLAVGVDDITRREAILKPQVRSEFLKWFDWFRDAFFSAHLRSLRQCGIEASTSSDVLRIAFANNVRCFSRNLVRSYAKFYDIARLALTSGDSESTSDERDLHVKGLLGTDIVFELSVLAASDFFPPNFNLNVKARWCPNLFEYDTADFAYPTPWRGLTMLRVLQALPASDAEASWSFTEIVAKLNPLGYAADEIAKTFSIAKEAALVERYNDRIEKGGTVVLRYRKTVKGVYLERLPFRNHDVLYLMATGCPLHPYPSMPKEPSSTLRRRYLTAQNELMLHRPNDANRYFPGAALRLGVHLLRHIFQATTVENRRTSAQINPGGDFFVDHDELKKLAHQLIKRAEVADAPLESLMTMFRET